MSDSDHNDIDKAIQAKEDSANERDIQTYTKWINAKLSRTNPQVKVNNLIEELRDGHVFLSLLGILLKIELRPENGMQKIHKITNVERVLEMLNKFGLELVGIHSHEIVSGEKTVILGVMWQIILYFQVQHVIPDHPNKKEAELRLIKWAQDLLKSFSDVTIVDITKSWRDGKAFVYILYVFRPDAVDIKKAREDVPVIERLNYAFAIAEDVFHVHRLVEPSDVGQDKKAMLIYLSLLFEVLSRLQVTPETEDYKKWKLHTEELESVLDDLDRKLDTKSDIKKEYLNLVRLAQEIKNCGVKIDDFCKPKLAEIRISGELLLKSKTLRPAEDDWITEKISSLEYKTSRVNTAVIVMKMKVRDAVLDYFNNILNEISVNLVKIQKTVTSLCSAASDLSGIRSQLASLKVLEKEIETNEGKLKDTKEKVNMMENAEVLPQDGFAGTLNDRCKEVRKELEHTRECIHQAKLRLYHALLILLGRLQKDVEKWLNQCEKEERNVDVDNLKDLDQSYSKIVILKQVNLTFAKGEQKYNILMDIYKEVMEENILPDKKTAEADKMLKLLVIRHDELQRRLKEKNDNLYSFLLDFANKLMDGVQSDLSEMEEKVDEQSLSDHYPQVKQDFRAAQVVIKEVTTVAENSSADLKNVYNIIVLNIFTDDDEKHVCDRQNDLEYQNAKLLKKEDEKFDNFAKLYNKIIKDEVKRRKMWLDENESWMVITDSDVDDLPGFEKKLEEQKEFEEELKRRKMDDLVDEAEHSRYLEPDTTKLIYQLDEHWLKVQDWSDKRKTKFIKITEDWSSLRNRQKELLQKVDAYDARLIEISAPVDLTNSRDTIKQEQNLKNLLSDVQELGLLAIKIRKSANALIKLVGINTPAARQIENQVSDVDTCRNTLASDTLSRIKKVDSSGRKTKALYINMDMVNYSTDECDKNLLNFLNEELNKLEKEEEKETEGEDRNVDEGIEFEEQDEEKKQTDEIKRKWQPVLKNFAMQIVLRLENQPGEKARVEHTKELQRDLEEDLSEKGKDVLKKQVNELDCRWEDQWRRMYDVVQNNEPLDVEVPLNDDLDYASWKRDVDDVNDSMAECQDVLQKYDVDVDYYPSFKRAETETQDIIEKMSQFRPKLSSLRISSKSLAVQDDSVTREKILETINSSQKNLDGLRCALKLRKLRLRDSTVQYISERIRDSEASVGEERVNLQLSSVHGRKLKIVLEQLSAVQESEIAFHRNQKKFEEVQAHLNEIEQSKILTSAEFQEIFQDDSVAEIAVQRALVLQKVRANRIRLHRLVTSTFEVKRKEVANWLKNCQNKENEVDGDAPDLENALSALKMLQDTENIVKQGEENYHETVELDKTVSEYKLLADKIVTDPEHDMKTASLKYNQILEEIQNKKNKLHKTVHQLMSKKLENTEKEIQESLDAMQLFDSQPEDQSATYDELCKLKLLVDLSKMLHEEVHRTFDKANILLFSDVLPKQDKDELRERVFYLNKRASDLHRAAGTKYDQVYKDYLAHFAKLIQLREEWLTANESRMEQPETTEAADISELESNMKEYENFEEELKAYDLSPLLKEVEMIELQHVKQELSALQERWEKLSKWSDKRREKLFKIFSLWSTFLDEETVILSWVNEKDATLIELADQVNLADENSVTKQLDSLKELRREADAYAARLTDVESMGHELKRIVGDHSTTGGLIGKQLSGLDEIYNKFLKQILQRIEKLESAQRRLQSIFGDMNAVTTWCSETELLMDELELKEKQLVSLNGDHSRTPKTAGKEKAELDEVEKETEQERKERVKEEKVQLRKEIISIVDKLAVKVDKLSANTSKVKQVSALHNELKEDDESVKAELDDQVEQFDKRWNTARDRLKDLYNKDLPERNECCVMQYIRRKMFLASINN